MDLPLVRSSAIIDPRVLPPVSKREEELETKNKALEDRVHLLEDVNQELSLRVAQLEKMIRGFTKGTLRRAG